LGDLWFERLDCPGQFAQTPELVAGDPDAHICSVRARRRVIRVLHLTENSAPPGA
jgi:hypothetical protein